MANDTTKTYQWTGVVNYQRNGVPMGENYTVRDNDWEVVKKAREEIIEMFP